ncbi:MAG: hypothetical protein KDB58_12855 [Solirubrobacterales bacterium]|nr:hypothetical protein [Solirubrobacterales bacterium]MCB8970009.1 hypothetical protein [Thermoleophilales bacterium]MCO5326980.1 hypothetical protein [Solirubrobacterales bacterium]
MRFAGGGLALILASLTFAGAANAAQPPGCAAADIKPGTTDAGLYRTIAPFEHFSSNRTQVFPHTCTLRQLTGSKRPEIAARQSPDDFSTPYIAATRNRGQLFVYGYGANAATEGGYVASVDPRTLEERWRTRITDATPANAWSYPGVQVVHGNGFIYAVYASVMVKLDPATGRTLARRDLPEDPDGTGAAYNGMVVLPDGRIVTKRIERGPCAVPPTAPAQVGAIGGLFCGVANALPTDVVVLDPKRLKIVSTTPAPEPITGRITAARFDGRDYIYAAGRDELFRFRYRNGRLRLDHGWGPVTYRTGEQQPGTGPGILGGFVVVQTNFASSPEPMTVTAVSQRDPDRVFRVQPFAGSGTSSFIVSKAALDAATMTVVTHDTAAGRMAAIRLDPERGFKVRWRRDITALAFSALVGGAKHREIVIPDSGTDGDEVVWLSERRGRELARSQPLAVAPAPGNIVTPGFDGRYYYVSSEGKLWELRPSAP